MSEYSPNVLRVANQAFEFDSNHPLKPITIKAFGVTYTLPVARSQNAIRVAKMLSAGQRRCLLEASSSAIAIYAENFVKIAVLNQLGLCHSPHGAVRETSLTSLGNEVRAVLMEGLK